MIQVEWNKKFKELGEIWCMRGTSLRMKGVVFKACVCSMLTYGATERRMLRMICGVTLNDMVESTVIASRVGVDDLEEHLRQKRLRWFGHRRDEEVEIKKVFELKIEGRRKSTANKPLFNYSLI